MVRRLYPVLAVGAFFVVAAPVVAQGMIPTVIGTTIGNMVAAGAAERRCLSGDAPSDEKIAAARAGADAAMRDYLRLAAKASPADASAAFTVKTKQRAWLSAGEAGQVTAVDDPLARSLAAAGSELPAPAAFYRARDGRSALATWVLSSVAADGAAAPLGHYRVGFRPEGAVWKITRLELVQGAAEPEPATQYCHVPGDVEEFRTMLAEAEAKRAQKKAEKAARRAARESGGGSR